MTSSGALVKAHPLTLQGYVFYLVSLPDSFRAGMIGAFTAWVKAEASAADSRHWQELWALSRPQSGNEG
jgi:hypothetical protein